MTSASEPVCVSVLMPVYNAERYVLQSVQSVLAQTFEDFELLVVDDCSTDGTAGILASIADRRLRVLRNQVNLGIVGTLNRAMEAARGRYVARADADDYCLPTRFAEQVAYLESHPDVLLTGTEMSILEGGQVRQGRRWADPDPAVLRWQFLVSNPLGHPSMMFRAGVVAALGTYLREEFKYAEDFDFSHRVMQLGDAAVLPDRLAIYRLHQTNLTRVKRDEMIAKTAAVLSRAYGALLGGDRAAEASLVAEHLMAGVPVASLAELERLGALLERLVAAFVAADRPGGERGGERARRVDAYAARVWWTAVQNALRAGVVVPEAFGRGWARWGREGRPPLHRLARSAVAGLVDRERRVSRWLDAGGRRGRQARADAGFDLGGARFDPVPTRGGDPPSLYVVVSVEADSSAPSGRGAAASGSAAQDGAQRILDRFGLRPIYVVDRAAASRPESVAPLRAILDRHACAVGALLRASANPPFADPAAAPGEAAEELEARELRALVGAIRRSFQVSPLFFKADRRAVGPRTMETLTRLGVAVDLSILPGADLTAEGGADFRAADARPYQARDGGLLSVPLTRAPAGPLAGRLGRRLGLANAVALTPEDVTAERQIRLIRAMAGQGHRTFTLHYRGLPVTSGPDRHAGAGADLAEFLGRIEAVCRFFVEDLGGMPGNPADLLPPRLRERVWPRPERAEVLAP